MMPVTLTLAIHLTAVPPGTTPHPNTPCKFKKIQLFVTLALSLTIPTLIPTLTLTLTLTLQTQKQADIVQYAIFS